MTQPSDEPDFVALVMAQWAAERPDLDVAPMAAITRLHRLADRLTEELVAVYAEHGLGEGEFDVLATLRRSGAPYELTPGELREQTVVSSGAITKRVDRCIERGLVTRRVNAADGRGRVVSLTPRGLEAIDRAFTAHVANEHRLRDLISPDESDNLIRVLRAWDRALDASAEVS